MAAILNRGHNARRQPGTTGTMPIDLEMAALEDLGPKTRYAINNGPLAVLAGPIVMQVIEHNDKIYEENLERAALGDPLKPYLDPKDPHLDEWMARNVMKLNFDLMSKDRELQDAMAGLKPLKRADRGRITDLRVVRAERVAERRARRFYRR